MYSQLRLHRCLEAGDDQLQHVPPRRHQFEDIGPVNVDRTDRFIPVASFVRVTWAPVMIAPEESFTVLVMPSVPIWG
jgi:hypothetical protein